MIDSRMTALVCFDGSSPAVAAVGEAARLFSHLRGEILHVWHPPPPTRALLGKHAHTGSTDAMLDEVIEVLQAVGSERAREVGDEGVSVAEAAGWNATPLLQRSSGGEWFEVVRLADEHEAGVIVLGARGLSASKRPLGSVSDAVVQLSRRPVLVVPEGDRTADALAEGPVVLAYDGSAGAQVAIERAAPLVGARRALVVHVAPGEEDRPTRVGEERERSGASELEQTPEAVVAEGVERARRAGFDAVAHVERVRAPIWRRPDWGAWRAIVDVAEAEGAAAVVVGARGRSAVRRVLLGSVSTGVLHHSARPVLVVPDRD